MQEFIQRSSERSVLVRTPDPERLAELITAAGGAIASGAADSGPATAGPPATKSSTTGAPAAGAASPDADDGAASMIVTGLPAPRIGELAASESVVLYELTPRLASLEEAFMELTADSVEYGESTARAAASGAPASGTERAMTTAQAPSAPARRLTPGRPGSASAACCARNGRRSGRSSPPCGRCSSS